MGQHRRAAGEQPLAAEIASWSTKRRWVAEAFAAFERAGYTVASGYAVVKNPATKFVYRDRLWQGADMMGLGVASFGHINGVHLQNLDSFGPYVESLERGELPLGRGFKPTPEERLIREFVLQLKLGSLLPAYFAEVVVGDVSMLRSLLLPLGIERVDVVLSGLPFPSLPVTARAAVLGWLAQHPEATFHQVTVMPWVYAGLYRTLFERVTFELVWRNVPPGGVYRCSDLRSWGG